MEDLLAVGLEGGDRWLRASRRQRTEMVSWDEGRRRRMYMDLPC